MEKGFSGVMMAEAVPVTGGSSAAHATPLATAAVGSATSTLVHAHIGTDGKTPTIFLPDGLEYHKPIQVQLPTDKVVSVQLPYGARVGQTVSLHYSWTSMKYTARIVQIPSSLSDPPNNYTAPSAHVATAVPIAQSDPYLGKAAETQAYPVDPKAQYKQEMQSTAHLYPAPSAPLDYASSSCAAESKEPAPPKDGKYHSVYEKEGYKGAEYKSVYQTGELSNDGYKGAEYKSVYE